MWVSWWRSSHVLNRGRRPVRRPRRVRAGALAGGLHHAVFRLAEQVESALGEEIQRERKAGGPVGEDAVVNVAAGGEVSGQGRGLFHISRPQRAYW